MSWDRAGSLHRVDSDGRATLVVSGPGLLGVTFDPTDGTLTACTDDAIYRMPQ